MLKEGETIYGIVWQQLASQKNIGSVQKVLDKFYSYPCFPVVKIKKVGF